jgi:hypothetical protein
MGLWGVARANTSVGVSPEIVPLLQQEKHLSWCRPETLLILLLLQQVHNFSPGLQHFI